MIHKTAIINSKAKISKNVQIGPYSVIGPEVEIGDNTIIHSHVNITGNTKIGTGNKIYPFVSINEPQDLKFRGESTRLIIGAESFRGIKTRTTPKKTEKKIIFNIDLLSVKDKNILDGTMSTMN